MKVFLVVLTLLIILLLALILFVFLVLTPADRRLFTTSKQTVQVQNVPRTYRTVNTSNDEPKPLLIALHGYQDRSWWLSSYAGLHLLAEEQDITLALPDGEQRSWNGIFCCGQAAGDQTDDVAFIRAMINEIANESSIDMDRIYIAGFSNGGILAQRLLAEEPDLFAAGAALMSGVGDRNYTLDISQAQAPILLINGTDDPLVPLNKLRTGPDFSFLPALQTADIWAEHYGLKNRQRTSQTSYDEYTWKSDTQNKLRLRLYDSSHRWPQWRLWGFPDKTPDSTNAMWDFLADHTK